MIRRTEKVKPNERTSAKDKDLCALRIITISLGICLGLTFFSATAATAGEPVLLPAEAKGVSSRIVGGELAPEGSWPSQVFVNPAGEYVCGGTLIEPRWIITAAHCVDDESVTAENTPVALGQKTAPFSNLQELTHIRVSPGYDSYSILNDIALLRLAKPSSLPTARVISPGQAALLQPGTPAYIAGWGTTCYKECSLSRDLIQATLQLLPDEECIIPYQDLFQSGKQLCAGAPNGGVDSCQGDSGGPLEVDGPDGRLLTGIVSFGVGCAEAEYPGVYTNISDHWDWLSRYLADSVSAPGKIRVRKRASLRIRNTDPDYSASLRFVAPGFRVSGCRQSFAPGQSCSLKVQRRKRSLGRLLIQNLGGITLAKVKLLP